MEEAEEPESSDTNPDLRIQALEQQVKDQDQILGDFVRRIKEVEDSNAGAKSQQLLAERRAQNLTDELGARDQIIQDLKVCCAELLTNEQELRRQLALRSIDLDRSERKMLGLLSLVAPMPDLYHVMLLGKSLDADGSPLGGTHPFAVAGPPLLLAEAEAKVLALESAGVAAEVRRASGGT
jgi:hypothetical protein